MEESLLSQWDDVEVLFIEEVSFRDYRSFWTLLRVLTSALVLLSTVLVGLQALVHLPCWGKTPQKEEKSVLPVSLPLLHGCCFSAG